MTGLSCARQAVAKHHSTPEAPLTEDVSMGDVYDVMDNCFLLGCYHHLWVCWGTGILVWTSLEFAIGHGFV